MTGKGSTLSSHVGACIRCLSSIKFKNLFKVSLSQVSDQNLNSTMDSYSEKGPMLPLDEEDGDKESDYSLKEPQSAVRLRTVLPLAMAFVVIFLVCSIQFLL